MTFREGLISAMSWHPDPNELLLWMSECCREHRAGGAPNHPSSLVWFVLCLSQLLASVFVQLIFGPFWGQTTPTTIVLVPHQSHRYFSASKCSSATCSPPVSATLQESREAVAAVPSWPAPLGKSQGGPGAPAEERKQLLYIFINCSLIKPERGGCGLA